MKLKLVDIDKLITDINDIHIEDLDHENEWNQALSRVEDIIDSLPELWWTDTQELYPELWRHCILTDGTNICKWSLRCDSYDNYYWKLINLFDSYEVDKFTHWRYLPDDLIQ